MGLSTNDLNRRMAEDTAYVSAVVSLLCLTGIFGNASVIFIYRFQIRRKLGNRKLLPTLATMDLITCLLGTAFILLQNAQAANFTNRALCKTMYVATYACLLASSLMIVVITVQRFLQVCHPLYLQGTPLFISHAPWTLSALGLILASPFGIFAGSVKYHERHYNSTGYRCNVDQYTSHKSYFIAYFSFLFLLFIAITIILSVLNSFIAKTLIHKRKEMRWFRRRNKAGRKGKGKGVCFSSVMMIEYSDLETRTEHIVAAPSHYQRTSHTAEQNRTEKQREPSTVGREHAEEEKNEIDVINKTQSVVDTTKNNWRENQESQDDTEIKLDNSRPCENPESYDHKSGDNGQYESVDIELQIIAEDINKDLMCIHSQSDGVEKQEYTFTDVPELGRNSCIISELRFGSSKEDKTAHASGETAKSERGRDSSLRLRVGHATITTKDISQEQDEDAEGTRYSIMLMVISLTFVLTWLPVLAVEVTEVTDHVTIEKLSPSVFAALRLCESFFIVNHVANPYIYAMFDSEFRARLLHIVFCVKIRQFLMRNNSFVK